MKTLFEKLCRNPKLLAATCYGYWMLIYLGTHVPIPEGVPLEQGSDKGIHFSAYAILAFLFWFESRKRNLALWKIAVLLLLYGVFDEWTQGFVGRDPDRYDFLADSLGVFAGLALASRFRL